MVSVAAWAEKEVQYSKDEQDNWYEQEIKPTLVLEIERIATLSFSPLRVPSKTLLCWGLEVCRLYVKK